MRVQTLRDAGNIQGVGARREIRTASFFENCSDAVGAFLIFHHWLVSASITEKSYKFYLKRFDSESIFQ